MHTQEMRSRGSIQEVPGEEVFKELLSYFSESHVQGRHLEPRSRAGDVLRAGIILHESVLRVAPGLVILNEI